MHISPKIISLKIAIPFALLFQFAKVSAQDIYKPEAIIKKNDSALTSIEAEINFTRSALAYSSTSEHDFQKERYNSKIDFLKQSTAEGDFILNSVPEKYVRAIFDNIVQANPELKRKYYIYVSRDGEPNAYSIGNGVIVVNIGLLTKLENDAQLAYILCHEVSHDFMDHSRIVICAAAKKYSDRDFRRQYRKAAHSRYMRNSKVKELILTNMADDRKYSREQESQADSIGIIFFKRTTFAPGDAMTALKLLGKIDSYYDSMKVNFKSLFDLPEQPFKSSWIENHYTSSFGNFKPEKSELPDSLRTHPQIPFRLNMLREMLGSDTLSGLKSFLKTKDDFTTFKNLCDRELICAALMDRNLSFSLFLTMLYAQDHPDEAFSKTMLSLELGRFCSLQKKHKVNTEFDLQSNDNPDSFNDYLDFMYQLRMSEVAAIATHYFLPESESLLKSEEYCAASLYQSISKDDLGSTQDKFNAYTVKFPDGKYKETLKELLPAVVK